MTLLTIDEWSIPAAGIITGFGCRNGPRRIARFSNRRSYWSANAPPILNSPYITDSAKTAPRISPKVLNHKYDRDEPKNQDPLENPKSTQTQESVAEEFPALFVAKALAYDDEQQRNCNGLHIASTRPATFEGQRLPAIIVLLFPLRVNWRT